MTQAQRDAHECGINPEHTDPRFLSQHLAAYAFARRLVQGKRVLEIGFGDGYGAHYLAETAQQVTGVDMAAGNITHAQTKYARPNLRFLHMEGTQLHFPNASFDVVGSFQVIEHIPEPDLIPHLTEVSRVLVPGGIYCLSTLNLEHNMKPGRPYEKLCYHEKEFTGPELSALLRRVFPHVEMHGLHLTWQHRVFQRLKRWGLNRFGPPSMNPITLFYNHMTVEAFTTKPTVSATSLDLIAVCRTALS